MSSPPVGFEVAKHDGCGVAPSTLNFHGPSLVWFSQINFMLKPSSIMADNHLVPTPARGFHHSPSQIAFSPLMPCTLA
jgi:hypothetical protein